MGRKRAQLLLLFVLGSYSIDGSAHVTHCLSACLLVGLFAWLPVFAWMDGLLLLGVSECRVPHFDAHPTPVNVSVRPKNVRMPQSG